MSRLDKAGILRLCDEMNKKEGVGSVFSLGSKHSQLVMPRWSTGIEDLDEILGGGMPEGRIIEIFGAESCGKTSLGYHLASLHQLALNIPIEGTFDAARAKSFGNKPKQMLVYRAKYGEQAANAMIRFARKGIPLIVLDSVPACKPKEDYEKAAKDVSDAERMGGVARLFHRTLPELEQIIEFTGTTVILINQVRDKMNAMAFGEQTDTPGGRAPKFYSSIRLQLARRQWIEIPNKNPRNSAKNEKVGIIMKVKCVKNKTANPMGEAEIPMFFDRGFESFDNIPAIKKELMKANNLNRGKTPEYEDDADSEEDED